MKKLVTLVILLLFVVEVSRAQYQQFYSQYIYSGLLINPAYAGSQDALNITAFWKDKYDFITSNGQDLPALQKAIALQHTLLYETKKLILG